MNKCFVLGAGEMTPIREEISSDDFVICADGGYVYAKKLGIMPNLILGDFDSAKKPDFENILTFKKEKNETDSFLALCEGEKRGFKKIFCYGLLGGERIDHTLSNIALLSYFAKKGVRVYLFGDSFYITLIKDEKICLDAQKSGYVSVFSNCDESFGVTIKGLKYEISDATLKSEFPLGVSNEFVGKNAEISVACGELLLVVFDH